MPLESHAWSTTRDHLAPFGVLERVENGVSLGFPDTVYCLVGVTGTLEMKATIGSITLDQVLFGERWVKAGGLYHVLLYADRTWFLHDAVGTRLLYEHAEPAPVVRAEGAFPLKEILRHLAPIERRVITKRFR
jgi:hypothetical protein